MGEITEKEKPITIWYEVFERHDPDHEPFPVTSFHCAFCSTISQTREKAKQHLLKTHWKDNHAESSVDPDKPPVGPDGSR